MIRLNNALYDPVFNKPSLLQPQVGRLIAISRFPSFCPGSLCYSRPGDDFLILSVQVEGSNSLPANPGYAESASRELWPLDLKCSGSGEADYFLVFSRGRDGDAVALSILEEPCLESLLANSTRCIAIKPRIRLGRGVRLSQPQ